MKILIIFLAFLSATTSFASFPKTETCTFNQIQLLSEAEGFESEKVRELLMLETPNFSCEVTTHYYAFPADCGRFTFVEYDFNVQVAATRIEAVVRDGGVSCTDEKRTELAKVHFIRQ